jgi:DNA-binding NtrC family response regulator
MTLKDMVLDYERRLILAALAASDGHQRRAAQSLGLLPTTLHEKMKNRQKGNSGDARAVTSHSPRPARRSGGPP